MVNKHDLLLLFERPTEPVFVAKGKNHKVFDVPLKFLTERYRPLVYEIQTIFGEFVDERIPVRDIQLPDLRIPTTLGRREQFSLFIPRHRRIAGRLIDIFMGAKTLDDLLSVTVFARDRVNPFLFNYALSVTLLHRLDTEGLDLPSLVHVFPNKFINAEVLYQVKEEASIVPEGSRMPIIVPTNHTLSHLVPEHSLWYFREDLGINLHHWHWHLVYPFGASDIKIIKKDRRGELFYYMHRQVITRYNVERFCNNLDRVKSFNNFHKPIVRGYFSKMDALLATRSWPPRCDNATLTDIKRDLDEIDITLANMELWRDHLYEAIDQGFAVDETGKRIYLNEKNGIDILANMVEASVLSPNRAYYGEIHNKFHLFISFCHDPQQLHLESFGIMGDSATAMRDPVFYELHSFIDDIFERHKIRLPAYDRTELEYVDITITAVQVAEEEGKPNYLSTFWQQSDVDISHGMDFSPRGSVFARFTHLQYGNFTYTIHVKNDSIKTKFGTVRIFLAPKYDNKGKPMLLTDQRLLMVELDRFVVSINPGINTIHRRSTDSSVTIPYERTFHYLSDKNSSNQTNNENSKVNFCGCGWPQHMLLPKGTPEGMKFQLFVMISNYEDDRVEQNMMNTCTDAFSYCGIRDHLYPDRRAMGFPFDRLPSKNIEHLVDFLTSNMFVADIVIRHDNRTVLRPVQ